MTDELVVVELLGLPLAVLNRASDHNSTLVRELALVHTADESGTAPARLLWLSQHLDQRYAAFNTAPRQRLQKAIEGDETHVDVHYEVPAHAAVAAAELSEALDEVDDYCRNGDLLTLVTPPEALSFRRWLLGEFVSQIQDAAVPTPWSDSLLAAESDAAGSTRQANQPEIRAAAAHAATITIVDDLDLEGAARVRGDFANLLDGGVTRLTVDLASCSFIDSVGISLLLTTRERLAQAGGTIVLTNVSGATRRTLETTGVYDILTKGT
jgi:anti-anti-sigma factor